MKHPTLLLTLLAGGITFAQDPAPPAPTDEPAPQVRVAKALPVTPEAAAAALQNENETEPALPSAAAAAATPPAPAPAKNSSAAKAKAKAEDTPEAAAKADTSPVPLPELGHYARLWTDSLFTTRAMPVPEAAGPAFTDNFTLSGTFEERGKMTAILIDKTTSNIIQVYIGEDNEQGIRISKIVPGERPDQMRIQLQKGNLTGWVNFTDSAPAEEPAAGNPVHQGRVLNPAAAAAINGSSIPPRPPGGAMIPQALPYNPATDPALNNVPAALPTMRGGMPAAVPALPNDPPLPPQ